MCLRVGWLSLEFGEVIPKVAQKATYHLPKTLTVIVLHGFQMSLRASTLWRLGQLVGALCTAGNLRIDPVCVASAKSPINDPSRRSQASAPESEAPNQKKNKTNLQKLFDFFKVKEATVERPRQLDQILQRYIQYVLMTQQEVQGSRQ